jgi:hypothetical protein
LSKFRLGWIAPAVVAALLSAGCGGASQPNTSARASSPAAVSPSAAATKAASSGFTGIIVASFRTSNSVELDAVDPATGRTKATRTFDGGSATIAAWQIDPWFTWASDFNKSLTELAATGSGPNGTTSAGYVDTSGNYVPLTAAQSSGFNSPPDKQAIGFAQDGDLWYQVTNHATQFGHVNPAVGPSSDRLGPYSEDSGNPQHEYMTLAGPEAASAGNYGFLPGGLEVDQAVSPGYQIAGWGRVTDSTPITPIKGDADNTDRWMVAAVGPRSFLTSDNDRGFLFLNTIEHGYVLTKSILPANSDLSFTSVAVSPDRHAVALVTNDGRLWIVPLTGGQPQQLTGFSVDTSGFGGLVEWTAPSPT